MSYSIMLHPSLNNTQYIDLVPDCKEMGIDLHVWTVNNKNDMERMVRLGVDAIITNYPDVAYEVLKGKKAPVSELRINVEGKPQEKERETVDVSRNRNPILHMFGVGYSKVSGQMLLWIIWGTVCCGTENMAWKRIQQDRRRAA